MPSVTAAIGGPAATRPQSARPRWGVGVVMWGANSGEKNMVGYARNPETRLVEVGARIDTRSATRPARSRTIHAEFAALRQALEAIDLARLPQPTQMDPTQPWVSISLAKASDLAPANIPYSLANAPQSFKDALAAAQLLGAKLLV